MSDVSKPAQSEQPTDNDLRRCEAYAEVSRTNRHFLAFCVDTIDAAKVDKLHKEYVEIAVNRAIVGIKSENARYRRARILIDMGHKVPEFPKWNPTA